MVVKSRSREADTLLLPDDLPAVNVSQKTDLMVCDMVRVTLEGRDDFALGIIWTDKKKSPLVTQADRKDARKNTLPGRAHVQF
jgi:hypothetical protein